MAATGATWQKIADQRSNFTRYLTALQAGDDNMALQYSKEIRSTVAERAKIVGAYAPQRAEVDVNVSTDPSASRSGSRWCH
ncbi:MAG: hypothetical protein JWQ86_3762 [Mycobacterium sp.]|nr:hypothetical protein [Mycobacterium sp.]